MKYIKLYEDYNMNEPKNGDWVICKENEEDEDDNFTLFINNNIGRIIKINNDYDDYDYIIKYCNIPKNIRNRFFSYKMNNKNEYVGDVNKRAMFLREIKYWSENKKDLEVIILTNKYNL